MKLSICTPRRTATHTIVWLELNTPSGNYIVQTGHAPTMLILTPQEELSFRLENGKQESLRVRNGIARIERNEVLLLIEESDARPS